MSDYSAADLEVVRSQGSVETDRKVRDYAAAGFDQTDFGQEWKSRPKNRQSDKAGTVGRLEQAAAVSAQAGLD